MRRIGYRHQRTLAKPATVSGQGLITGAPVRLRFYPAPPNTGRVFLRSDLDTKTTIEACAEQVTGTARRTTLGPGNHGVTLVEHVLASVAGMRIDNCVIELDAMEPPGLDGSAFAFVQALNEAGTVMQPAYRTVWTVAEPVFAAAEGATLAIYPPEPDSGFSLRVNYILDYGRNARIPRQSFTTTVSPESVMREVAACRTFVMEEEVQALQRQGIGLHLTAADLLVFGANGPIGNTLRFADEPARHKVLDLIGDLALSGLDLAGRVVAYRSGHSLNVTLATMLADRVKRVNDTDLADWSLCRSNRRLSA